MLIHLSVQNYALLEKISIDFPDGLSVITGETGAGKSILLGALSLIAGSRADTSVLQDKGKKCIVEGTFFVKNYSFQDFFSSNELDYEEITVLRREISPEGKSRAFINDTPVNLSVLKELSLKLIDIHSQHGTLLLNEAEYQLSVIDAFAGTAQLAVEYKTGYAEYRKSERILAELMEKEKQSMRDADYWQFQYDELEEVNLQPGEQEEMENELKVLTHSEEIKSALEKTISQLNAREENILSALGEIKNRFAALAKISNAYEEISSRIHSSWVELKDIADEIERSSEKIIHDPARVEQIVGRLDTLYRLQKKHGVNSTEELIAVKNNIQKRLAENTSLEKKINDLQAKNEKMRSQLFVNAKKLSTGRIRILLKFEKAVSSLLASLALPGTQFRTEHTLLETLTENGIDKIKFLFSANKGSGLKEISKTASGGELSRLMLIIKYLIAEKTALPTILFDEIDSGVSGGTAERVGQLIQSMAKSMQVVVITHLPQIASKGKSHFCVHKKMNGEKTFTCIRPLTEEERVLEIAKLLSAGKPTATSVKNARELLNL